MIIFLSYKWEDNSHANGMAGLLNNPNNDYRHITKREKEDLRSEGENAWRSYIRTIVRECDALICLIGKETHNATGVIYELEIANSFGINIIPVRIPNTRGGAPRIIRNRDILNWDAIEINNELSRR